MSATQSDPPVEGVLPSEVRTGCAVNNSAAHLNPTASTHDAVVGPLVESGCTGLPRAAPPCSGIPPTFLQTPISNGDPVHHSYERAPIPEGKRRKTQQPEPIPASSVNEDFFADPRIGSGAATHTSTQKGTKRGRGHSDHVLPSLPADYEHLDFISNNNVDNICNTPYEGDWKGMTWNARALCHTDEEKRTPKYRLLQKWSHTEDFIILQETHMTSHAKVTLNSKYLPCSKVDHSEPSEPGATSTSGGLAIVFRDTFLLNFTRISRRTIIGGRAVTWKLEGKKGCMSITGIYAHSDCHTKRLELWNKVKQSIPSSSHSLVIIAGDLNYAANHFDRFGIDGKHFTGGSDKKEAARMEKS